MIRTIVLSRLLAFGLWLRRRSLDRRCLRRELWRLLSKLSRFFRLGVGRCWRHVGVLVDWFFLSPILNRSLSQVLFVRMLWIYLLSLGLNLLLVLLLMQRLMVELTGIRVRILILA